MYLPDVGKDKHVDSLRLAGRVYLGRYEVVRLLGEGGMGRVYLARQRDQHNRQVAVKVLHEKIAGDPKSRERFQREMRFMTRFQHPHVVSLYEASFSDPKEPCIVMEYIQGTSLDQVLRKQRRFDPVRAGKLLGQLCSALQAAHAAGIIHRDLKPANIMVIDPDTPQERIKVMDFGLAKLATAPHIDIEQLRGSETIIATGTPEYICPEQTRGDEVDHRGDLYGVGVILFELLTGRVPFSGRTTIDTLLAHAEKEIPRFVTRGVPNLSPAVEKVVRDCLAKFPNERPQTALELAERYGQALGQKIALEEDKTITPTPAMPRVADLDDALPEVHDPNAIKHHFEAWMPERIAVIKLRGFVDDVGGEVVESVPGMVRVRLGGPNCRYQLGNSRAATPEKRSLMSWLGAAKKAEPVAGPMIDMELHMKKNPGQAGQLNITSILRQVDRRQRVAPIDWHAVCDQIGRDLRAYLMSR